MKLTCLRSSLLRRCLLLILVSTISVSAVAQEIGSERYAVAIGPHAYEDEHPYPWETPMDLQEAWLDDGLPEFGGLVTESYGDDWGAFAGAWTEDLSIDPPAFTIGERSFLESLLGFEDEYECMLARSAPEDADALLVSKGIVSSSDVILGTVDPAIPSGGGAQLEWLRSHGYAVHVAVHKRAVEALLHVTVGRTDLAAVPAHELEAFAADPRYARLARALTVHEGLPSGAVQAVFVQRTLLETEPGVAYAVRKILHTMDPSLLPQPMPR